MKLHWFPIAAVLSALMLSVSAFGYYRYWNGGLGPLGPAPTPSPTPIERVYVETHNLSRCNYSVPLPEWGWTEESFIRWMPDGSQILFQMGPKVFAVDTAGSHLRMVADATWEVVVDGEVRYRTATMTSWDVSPDGSRLAFSKCGVDDQDLYTTSSGG